MTDVVYVAIPHTDPDPKVRDGRWHIENLAAAHIIKTQHAVVHSPITMTDPLDRVLAGSGKTLGSEYWVQFDQTFMEACSRMVIAKIPGWDKSKGIAREIKHFEAKGEPVEYLEEDELFSSLSADELKVIPSNAWLAVSRETADKYMPRPPAPKAPPFAPVLDAGCSKFR